MNKRDFIENYGIKDARPNDPSLRVIPAEGFAAAIEEFINERFHGVARARSDVRCSDLILVCPEYVAMFFKTLLADIYGRSLINITISSDYDKMTVLIESDGLRELTEGQMRNLIRLARNGGMRISLGDECIYLWLTFSEARIRRVYAISANGGRRTMLSTLGEIFYCGEPLDPDTPPEALLYPPKLKAGKGRRKAR